ncbi:MAG: hypothetical protein EDX89_22705 [Acidobacteria bacterium]|nr:MAG: hypothetical protein EDX89_22705 [Acidobacteriota bacterium]
MEIDEEVLDDLILGRGVRRGRHLLLEPVFPALEGRLRALGFVPATVGELDVPLGVRLPAWLLSPPVADFGAVLWEVFTDRSRRKLFGTEVRNAKGDWDVVILPGSRRLVWANPGLAETYDASRPVGMY